MGTQVDYEKMLATSRVFAANQGEIEALLQGVTKSVHELVGTGFATDRASEAFRRSHEEWDKGAKAVVQALAGMKQFLEAAVQQYQQVDQTLTQQVSGH